MLASLDVPSAGRQPFVDLAFLLLVARRREILSYFCEFQLQRIHDSDAKYCSCNELRRGLELVSQPVSPWAVLR